MFERKPTVARPTHRLLLASVSALLLAGCASTPPPTAPAKSITTSPVPRTVTKPAASLNAADIAIRQVGTPYRWGGQSPNGFDCSGLVRYSFGKVGISLPRTTSDQRAATLRIERSSASRGDLLFFRTGVKDWHVGIYLGDGEFVHAPSSGKTVTTGSMTNPYYRKHLVDVRRVRPTTLATRSD